jgi:hypothetical protein
MSRRGWSIIELLVCVAVVALLLGLLVPTLLRARDLGFRTVCANNLRQQNMAWQSYVQDNKDVFPLATGDMDWSYGGVSYVGPSRVPVLASDRPINAHLAEHVQVDVVSDLAALFRCPSDRGVTEREKEKQRVSVLSDGTCYETFGNSYRANATLFDSTRAGFDSLRRPLAMHEIQTATSRLLLTGDATWYYATQPKTSPDALYEANWHQRRDFGNMLAVDGSVRSVDFAADPRDFFLSPRVGTDSVSGK